MELVANVWPVADQRTGMVQRFFMRAYVLEADDTTISRTLTALAPADFRLARVFAIPTSFTTFTKHGPLKGCVGIGDFHQMQFQILEPFFAELEKDFAKLQGIASGAGEPVGVAIQPRFPADPYLVVTTLVETPEGRLLPQLPKA